MKRVILGILGLMATIGCSSTQPPLDNNPWRKGVSFGPEPIYSPKQAEDARELDTNIVNKEGEAWEKDGGAYFWVFSKDGVWFMISDGDTYRTNWFTVAKKEGGRNTDIIVYDYVNDSTIAFYQEYFYDKEFDKIHTPRATFFRSKDPR